MQTISGSFRGLSDLLLIDIKSGLVEVSSIKRNTKRFCFLRNPGRYCISFNAFFVQSSLLKLIQDSGQRLVEIFTHFARNVVSAAQ